MSQRHDAADWLISLRAPGMGAQRLKAALAKHGSIQALRRSACQGRSGLPAKAEKYIHTPDESVLAADLGWLAVNGHHLLCWGDDWYPNLLAETDGAPATLFVVGELATLWRPQIALVGSRKASPDGCRIAADFAAELAYRGFVITSGLARGIDASAHEAALRANGQTLAVLGTGPDQVYPKQHWQLSQRIAAHGALVTEYPPGTPAHSGHFPTRNRIISGLALGVLVVEASLKSGSLITARQAAEQGREVLAIPGPVYHPQAQGCHQLIREGAKLVANVDHILEALRPIAAQCAEQLQQALAGADTHELLESDTDSPHVSGLPTDLRTTVVRPVSAEPAASAHNLADLDEDYRLLLATLNTTPLVVDDIVTATDLTPEAVSSMLLILELKGLVVCHDGGKWCRHHEIAL